MNKFILSSFLLILLFGTVSSDPAALKVVSDSKGYKTSTELRGYYSQQNSQVGGYHKAEVYFKTKVQSLNPDQAGVSKIDCKDGKITLSLNNRNEIKQINDWPDKVMLLISHKWKCFGKTTTQFFMIKDKTVDSSNKKVTFTVEECNITEWADDFLLDVSWEDGKTKRRIARDRDSLDKRINLPPINVKNTISLNVLFDEKTGKTSQPDIPLIDDILFCANCFMNGEATIALRVAAKVSLFKFKLTDATISLNGNVKLNVDLAAKSAVGKGIDVTRKIINIPIPPGFGIPRIFSVGPSIELVASSELSSSAGATINFGGEVALPNFSAKATFVDKPKFVQSGFKPKAKSHGLKIDVDASVDINGSLKPRLAFGIDVLNGRFSRQAGFELVTSLDSSISVGKNNKCKRRTQPRLKTTLGGNIGFFVDDDNFPIVEFPEISLINKCV